MNKNIFNTVKIAFATILSLVIVLFASARSPYALYELFISRSSQLLSSFNQDSKETFPQVEGSAVIPPVELKPQNVKKRVYQYKGKKLIIYSNNNELSEEDLEFFYNLELEKEKTQQK